MDQFMYVADPGSDLRMRNRAYLEQVSIMAWRITRQVEDPGRLDEELRQLLRQAGEDR
jgi:hypothetical protein